VTFLCWTWKNALRDLATRTGARRLSLARHTIAIQSTSLGVAALFLLALAPRLLLIYANRFDGLYGQDAYAYYDYARLLFGVLSQHEMPPPFWWPLGYPALLNFGFLVFGTTIHAAQFTTLVSGALAAPVTFLLTREVVGGPRANLAGLVAGAIVAMSGQMVQSSIVVMADAPALMWAALGAWLLIRHRRTNDTCSLIISAAATAFAVVTRWENLGFAAVWVAAYLVPDAPLPESDKSGYFSVLPNRRILPMLVAAGLAGLILVPQIVYNLTSSAPLAGQSWLEGWSPLNSFARSFDNVDGHFDYVLPVALFYAQVLFHPAYIFPLLTPFLFLGAWQLAKKLRSEPSAFVLIFGWIAAFYVFLAGIPYENFRFGLGFFVPAACLTGIGVAWAWGKSLQRPLPFRGPGVSMPPLRHISYPVLGLAAIALIGTAGWEPRVLQPVLAEKEMELADVKWLPPHLQGGAVLYAFGVTEALQNYTRLKVKDLSEESPNLVVPDMRSDMPAYLFVDVDNIDTQWRGMPLQKTLHTIRDELGWSEIDHIGRFSLILVGAAQ
jgi:Dolichyl-phosphate-mannose-protein mannosyltransferase